MMKLKTELTALYELAGRPSYSSLSGDSGVARTTVHDAIAAGSRSLPSWKSLNPIVEALGGDTDLFLELWNDAEAERRQPAIPDMPDVAYEVQAMRAELGAALSLLAQIARKLAI